MRCGPIAPPPHSPPLEIATDGLNNYGAGLSSINVSLSRPSLKPSDQCFEGWVGARPSLQQLRERFKSLTSAGVQAIALETGSPDPENVTEMFLPLMREYLAGGMFDDVVLPVKSDDRSTRVDGP